MNRKRFPRSLILASLALTAPVSAAEVNIVTSIKPVELLVKAVAGDAVDVTSLVPPGASPHNYTMKPSQRRALAEADLVFWVGPAMETFLNRLLSGQEFADKTVAFTEAAPDEKGEHNAHGHEESGQEHEPEHPHEHGHHDHGDGEDPHIWVDPLLALDMARTIKSALGGLGSLDERLLENNLARFEQKLMATEISIRASFQGLEGVSLFAYHDAYTRFAEHYGLSLHGVLTLNPELSPGARHVAEVQQKLRTASQPCLLTEPQFNRQWWHSITEGLNVRFSTWDPLATDIPSTPDGYIQFQQAIATATLNCLPEQGQHQRN
ncbi:ABC transporter substrate-binding protein [Marinobacter fuscus]|uniref:High-affinity zinc uptake system protein ZnuA n=1 Tax=Marinobacter fuscus TaxID=2109942 RepID=A0A2T1K5H1_9GAMM|nr:zinc ABC transporter substrate-binding protein [Marinobacter fuscus]PSF05409.1 ABC transporter substrate-binding protein [Marinobacter fuscus]